MGLACGGGEIISSRVMADEWERERKIGVWIVTS